MEASNLGRILPREIDDEMKSSYLDYAMSVIVSRALPDARDGLKPVHRRILYAMFRDGLLHNKGFSKCAGVVGEVLKKYHPHGDAAVYDALVRLAQPWNMRYILVDGQGNFGSIDGDSAAAYRYTETRLNRLGEEMLLDIDKETVGFVPNFDSKTKEPTVLPSKIPNLLINGSSGIAVGMATNIPPHNTAEVVDAATAQIDNPDIEIDELMQYVSAPDFPTGGLILGMTGVREAYKKGYGIIRIRGKTTIEKTKNSERIIVTEIPYQVNKAQLIEQIAELASDKKVTGISDLSDESNREGIRIVIDLKKDANSDVVLNQLFTHSRLESSFGIIMIALVDNQPKVLTLKDMLQHFIDHRVHVVTKRTEFDLRKAAERSHLLEGIIIALQNIDAIVDLIKKSRNTELAAAGLTMKFRLSELQAKAVLDIRLQRLSSLEQEKIRQEQSEILQEIKRLKEILSSRKNIMEVIKQELKEIREMYGDRRRTTISEASEEIEVEDLIKPEEMVITITHSGYIKRSPLSSYRQQHRGGRGATAAGTKEGDFIEDIFTANTHSYILFFTDKGNVHWIKVYSIPEASKQAMGKAIVNLLELENEKVSAFVPVKHFDKDHYLVLTTKKGITKKTNLEEYSRPRKGGIIAINLEEGDELINAELTDGKKQLIIATKEGLAVRFEEADVRSVGRNSKGVTGIRLKGKDGVVGMVLAQQGKAVFTVTENGYGKRTPIEDYRLINRGGSGVINMKLNEKTGNVVAVKSVDENDELMLITKNGIAIRVAVRDISEISRNTQGVRIIKLEDNDKVVAAALIANE